VNNVRLRAEAVVSFDAFAPHAQFFLPQIFYQPHPGDRAGRSTVSLSLSICSVPCVFSVGHFQRFSVSAFQRFSVSAFQRFSVSAFQRFSVSAFQRFSVSAF
jgi:hypothetical protein